MKNNSTLYIRTLLIIVAIGIGPVVLRAQDATPTPTPTPDPELVKLQQENARAEERKKREEIERDRLKAKREALEARFPSPNTTPLEGKTTIDGLVIESEIRSFDSMAEGADKITEHIKKNLNETTPDAIAVHSAREMKVLLGYSVTVSQIKVLQSAYGEIIHGVSAFPTTTTYSTGEKAEIATSVLGSFIDLTAFLRTDTDIKGQTFNIEEVALVAEVFRAMRESEKFKHVRLYYPSEFPPRLDPNKQYVILAMIQKLFETKNEAEELIGNLEEGIAKQKELETAIKELEPEISGLGKKKADLETERKTLQQQYVRRRVPGNVALRIAEIGRLITEIDTAKAALETKLTKTKGDLAKLEGQIQTWLKKLKIDVDSGIPKLKLLNAQVDKLISDLTKTDEGTGVSVISNYVQAENLDDALKCKDSYWLQLKVIHAGGNNRVKRNLVTRLFTGDNVSHSGGSIVEFNLYTKDGASVSSGTHRVYSKYVDSSRIGSH
jgi:hypothetical protein